MLRRQSKAHLEPVTDWVKSKIMRASQPTQFLSPREPGAVRIRNGSVTGIAYIDPVPATISGHCVQGLANEPRSHYSTVSPIHKNKLAAARGSHADMVVADSHITRTGDVPDHLP